MSLVREKLSQRNLSSTATSVILSSWRKTSSKQYKSYLLRWESFCTNKNIDKFTCEVEQGLEFLAHLFDEGLGYSAINTARSALSSVIILPGGITFGEHPLVCRFLKGVFELRPSLPKYSYVWDVGLVLRYLHAKYPISTLSLKELTLKTNMLVCLLTGQRSDTIHKLCLANMQTLDDRIIFVITELLKTSKPGSHLEPIIFIRYEDPALCVVHHILEYIARTNSLRQEHSRLFLSFQKPHRPVSNSTIARWAKFTLKSAGINTSQFGAHSTRSASTSYARKVDTVPLKTILKSGGWSSAKTFAKFYDKPISADNFGDSILQHFNKHP